LEPFSFKSSIAKFSEGAAPSICGNQTRHHGALSISDYLAV